MMKYVFNSTACVDIRFFWVILLYAMSAGCSFPDSEKGSEQPAEKAGNIEAPDNMTPETLGASMVLALKENKYSYIETFLPQKEDVENILLQFKGSVDKKKKILAIAKENTKRIRQNTHRAFDTILKKGEHAGLQWPLVEFLKTEYKITMKNNLEYADLNILFRYKGLKYAITISECIHTDRGWLIFDRPKWKG